VSVPQTVGGSLPPRGSGTANIMPPNPGHRPESTSAFRRAHGRDPAGIERLQFILGIPADTPDRVLELMSRCTDAAVDILEGVDHAGITASFDGHPLTVAPTDTAVERFDQQQYEFDDGPCLHALRTAETTRMDVAEVGRRWPPLGSAARKARLTGFLATPLFAEGVSVGSLNLYSHTTVSDTTHTNDLVTILADYLNTALESINLIARQGRAARTLRDAIASRIEIEHAVGVLMGAHTINAADAFSELEAGATLRALTTAEYARLLIGSVGDKDY
jgi:hypothetical protein